MSAAGTGRWGRLAYRVSAGALLAVFVTLGLGGAAGSAAPPTVTLSTTTLVPGQSIMIGGSGWAPDTAFQAVLCGSDANAGSNDCSVAAASTFVPFNDGSLHGVLQVVVPPVPCPCVVEVSGTNNDYITKIPVTVVGAQTAPVTPPAVATPSRVSAVTSLRSVSSVGAIFGGSAGRVLTVTLHNGGAFPVTSLVTARWGSSSSSSNVITSPPAVTLMPGQTRTLSLPFTLDPLSHGSYHVVGQVSGTEPQLTFSTTTTTWPWGIPLVILAVVALLIFRSYRHRQRAEQEQRRLEEIGAVDGASGLGALAAMSWTTAVARDLGDSLRIKGALLIGDLDGTPTAVPVAVLLFDSRGVGVTNPTTNELRILAWDAIHAVHVIDRSELTDAPDFLPATGAVIEVETTPSTYRFAVPDRSSRALGEHVDHLVGKWIRPPAKVPSLATSG